MGLLDAMKPKMKTLVLVQKSYPNTDRNNPKPPIDFEKGKPSLT